MEVRVPGAVATGSQLYNENRDCEDVYPAATAFGTDLILKIKTRP
jgi:hypothetical protein